MSKQENHYYRQARWLSGSYFAVTGNRPGCMPLLLVFIGIIFVIYLLTADSEKVEDPFVYGNVINAYEQRINGETASFLLVKLDDGNQVSVSVPEFVMPHRRARIKLSVNHQSLDSEESFRFGYVDIVNQWEH